jgi:hypothetical protein
VLQHDASGIDIASGTGGTERMGDVKRLPSVSAKQSLIES